MSHISNGIVKSLSGCLESYLIIRSIYLSRFKAYISCMHKVILITFSLLFSLVAQEAELLKRVDVPTELQKEDKSGIKFGGDIRIGDLNGDGSLDFLVYRSIGNFHDSGGMKPCFLGAFDINGKVLWKVGGEGTQPSRPGPVTLYDFDGDGKDEVLSFFHNGQGLAEDMSDVLIQIRSGETGGVVKQSSPQRFKICKGMGANWVHQRLLICNLSGGDRPTDFIVKLGTTLLAFNKELQVLWSYQNKWNKYSECPAYIPSVGDFDGDGLVEINGGYFLLNYKGKVLWEKKLGKNMDSVAIGQWNGKQVAFCSGYGHIMDSQGNVILKLGKKLVPHGQELRVGDFDPASPGNEMAIRYDGHKEDLMIVGQDGNVLRKFKLNSSPNETGLEEVRWFGKKGRSLLYNGGQLWNGDGTLFSLLPGLPKEMGDKKQGWYHCIPVDLAGDIGEEIVVYNPWDNKVFLYGKDKAVKFKKYKSTERQYNVRLMD